MDNLNKKSCGTIFAFIERWYYLFLAVVLIVLCFNLFCNLGKIPINSWDEARHGVSAYEMLKNKNYVVNTYSYKNDYWNLKPPLSFWAIAVGYKVIGFDTIGLRVFSAAASIGTVAVIASFTMHINGKVASLISAVILATTVPFITEHCARTGDADALFIFFHTAAIICLALASKNINWLYLAGLSFSMAFLAKSWHAGGIVVIFIIYSLIDKLYLKLVVRKALFIFFFSLLPITAWIFFRYREDGLSFFNKMINYDLLERAAKPIEGHIGNNFYYLIVIRDFYSYWFAVFIVFAAAVILQVLRDKIRITNKNDFILLGLWVLIPVIIYTKAETKISWYITPIYPAMAIITGILASTLLKMKNAMVLKVAASILLVSAVYKNEKTIIDVVSNPPVDVVQQLFKSIGNKSDYQGKRIYICHIEQSYWLCSELYGDLMPSDGGIDAFMNDNLCDSILFVTKDRMEFEQIKGYSLRNIAENDFAGMYTK